MVKTIIFDLDGVLVYTDKFHYLAWKKMADRIGVPFDETINNRLRGVSRNGFPGESSWRGAPGNTLRLFRQNRRKKKTAIIKSF